MGLRKEGLCQRCGSLPVLLAALAVRSHKRCLTQVIATARKPEQLVGLKGRYSERVRTVALDVTNEAQAKAAFEAAITSFRGLDVLVNNAGYGYVCPVEDTSLADFRAQGWTHHPGNLDRRTHRTSRARTVRSREVRG